MPTRRGPPIPEQPAEHLRGFADHVQVFMQPLSMAAIGAFAPVPEILDRG